MQEQSMQKQSMLEQSMQKQSMQMQSIQEHSMHMQSMQEQSMQHSMQKQRTHVQSMLMQSVHRYSMQEQGMLCSCRSKACKAQHSTPQPVLIAGSAGTVSWTALATVVHTPSLAVAMVVLGSLGTACSDVVVDSIVVERSRGEPQVPFMPLPYA